MVVFTKFVDMKTRAGSFQSQQLELTIAIFFEIAGKTKSPMAFSSCEESALAFA
jgi:hypothetical protein